MEIILPYLSYRLLVRLLRFNFYLGGINSEAIWVFNDVCSVVGKRGVFDIAV